MSYNGEVQEFTDAVNEGLSEIFGSEDEDEEDYDNEEEEGEDDGEAEEETEE